MAEVIPAIIPRNFDDLKEKMSLVVGTVPLVQVDVLDGKLTSGKSWPYTKDPDPDFVKILKEEEGFPFWEDLDFEVDLMVSNPEMILGDWVIAGARRIIVHIESFGDNQKASKAISDFKEKFGVPGSPLDIEIGLAVGIETGEEMYLSVLENADFVQFMGIAQIGKQGEPFDDRVLEKISSLRKQSGSVIISVDGGVNLESAPLLVSAGANRLVAGSAIFESEDISLAIEDFKNI